MLNNEMTLFLINVIGNIYLDIAIKGNEKIHIGNAEYRAFIVYSRMLRIFILPIYTLINNKLLIK